MQNQNKTQPNLRKSKYLSGSLIFIGMMVFLYVGFLWGKNSDSKDEEDNNVEQSQSKEIRQAGYQFINPLLECEMASDSPILKSSELKIKKTIQEELIAKNPDTDISLYYRDLKNGPAFGINEQAQYSPASLLKVPLMIAYYKYAENNPDIFEKEVTFEKTSIEIDQKIMPQQSIKVGETYKIWQLIEAMIKHSDNEAANLLFQNIDLNEMKVVFNDLGLSMPNVYDFNNSISVKDYASFFRILYNASYLDREMSEQSLGLLSSTQYETGLVSGVPRDKIISHKFGEREFIDEKGKIVRQLHDCGIIYHPSRPYLLCVMTRGSNFEDLSQIISQISTIIYKEVDSH